MQASPQGSFQAAPSPSSPTVTAFAPLPLRARGVLEILDIAIKVYKQYFLVLLGWSAIVIIGSTIGTIAGFVIPFGGTLPSVMLTPLITGVVACCIAAAVRGQSVTFGQCWEFTKPRFWPMVGYYVVALIIVFVVVIGLFIVFALIVALGIWAFNSSPESLQILMGIIGGFFLLTLGTIAMTVILTWHYMVPIVVCMEDDKMSTRALTRAFELVRRQWVQVCTLMTIEGLGMIFLWIILFATAAVLIGIPDVQRVVTGGQVTDTRFWQIAVAGIFTYVVLWMIWNPIFYLTLMLFYLDVRIRQEALDLEWAAHTTAPRHEMSINIAPGMTPGALHTFAPTTTPPLDPSATPAYGEPTSPINPYDTGYGTSTLPSITPATSAPDLLAQDTPISTPPTTTPLNTTVDAPFTTYDAPFAAYTEAPAPPLETTVAESAAPVVAPDNPVTTDATIICPQCGADEPASQIACTRCGARLRLSQEQPARDKPLW